MLMEFRDNFVTDWQLACYNLSQNCLFLNLKTDLTEKNRIIKDHMSYIQRKLGLDKIIIEYFTI